MRIVLSRLDRIGDLVLSTPAIASVRRSWPDAHLTIACSAANAPVVARSPDVDAIAVMPTGVRPAVFGQRFAGACDLAVALAPTRSDFELVRATGARKRVGYTYVRRFVARAAARWYLTDVALSEADPDLCERDPAYTVRHEVDQVLDLVPLAGGTVIVRDLLVPVSERDRQEAAHVPQGAIVFHLAARWLSCGSSLASVRELLRMLRGFGFPVVVTCGPEMDDGVLAAVARMADAVARDLPFLTWAAVFERSRLVITVDTGATHVASAMKRPTVVVFERKWFRLSSQEWAPYRVPSVSLCKPAGEDEASLAALRESVVIAVGALLEGSHEEAAA